MSGQDGIRNVNYNILMHSVRFKARRQNEQDNFVHMQYVRYTTCTGITCSKADAAGTPLTD